MKKKFGFDYYKNKGFIIFVEDLYSKIVEYLYLKMIY